MSEFTVHINRIRDEWEAKEPMFVGTYPNRVKGFETTDESR